MGCSEGQVSVCPASGVVGASELLWEVFATPPPDPAVPFGGALPALAPPLRVCDRYRYTGGKTRDSEGSWAVRRSPARPPCPFPTEPALGAVSELRHVWAGVRPRVRSGDPSARGDERGALGGVHSGAALGSELLGPCCWCPGHTGQAGSWRGAGEPGGDWGCVRGAAWPWQWAARARHRFD